MTLWIDPPRWPAHGRLWSHLISDNGPAELWALIERLDLPPGLFEGDHVDIPAEQYDAVVAAGAVPTTGTDLARRLRDSGQRFRKRRGERPLGRVTGVPGLDGIPHQLDLVRSSIAPPTASTVAALALVRQQTPSGEAQVLLVQRDRHGDWGLPGGGIEPGEDAPAAAARELREEAGGRIEASSLVHVAYERLTVARAVGRFAVGDNYLAVLEAPRDQVQGALEGRPAPDVRDRGWFTGPEAHRRAGHEPWWPILEALAFSQR